MKTSAGFFAAKIAAFRGAEQERPCRTARRKDYWIGTWNGTPRAGKIDSMDHIPEYGFPPGRSGRSMSGAGRFLTTAETVKDENSMPMARGAESESNPRRTISGGFFPGWMLLSLLLFNPGPADREPAADARSAGRTGKAGQPASLFTNPDPPAAEIPSGAAGEFYDYRTQSGDTLYTIAVRFNAYYSEIRRADGLHLPESGLLPPGTELIIPKKFQATTDSTRLFPDSEIVYSPSAAKFNVTNFLLGKRGYLFGYTDEEGLQGGEIISKLAWENSINPKVLLALLEYASGWVADAGPPESSLEYPMHFLDPYNKGLYRQMMLAINFLERGYYGWRTAKILCLYFGNGVTVRLAPDLNAGTVAVLFYFSRFLSDPAVWSREVRRFYDVYTGLFGDPAADALDPLYPESLYQPYLILPFPLRQSWCFSNGPHGAWDAKGPEAAVDFAPPQYEYSGPLSRMLLASATGCVVRSEKNALVLDLDCDGSELTGWDIFYFHLAEEGKARLGSKIRKGQKIGYASSEGGVSSGIHVHMARKYNGEWILADGPLPFTLSGWTLTEGDAEGEWMFTRGGAKVFSSIDCDFENMIAR
jgi:LasA protease